MTTLNKVRILLVRKKGRIGIGLGNQQCFATVSAKLLFFFSFIHISEHYHFRLGFPCLAFWLTKIDLLTLIPCLLGSALLRDWDGVINYLLGH